MTDLLDLNLEPCDDLMLRFPNGAVLHLEYLEGISAGIACTGYKSEADFHEGQIKRLHGFADTRAQFHETIPDEELRKNA